VNQTYNLDLEMMLTTLARRQLSGRLFADIVKGKKAKEGSHVEIVIDRGKIISCRLSIGSIIMNGEQALQMIRRQGTIPWTFLLASTQSSNASVMPGSSRQLSRVIAYYVPRRLVLLSSSELARLPRFYFQVYANIDGKKTSVEIARVLRVTSEQVERVCLDLQSWQLIQVDAVP
jgi:hypothetical protein